MKQSINIRGDDGKPKVGSYQHAREQLAESSIEQIKKKSINSSTNFPKVSTTKNLRDQLEESK